MTATSATPPPVSACPTAANCLCRPAIPRKRPRHSTIPIWLNWPGELPPDYVPFVHLRRGDTLISQSDGPPHVFLPAARSDALTDWREITLPPDVSPGDLLTLVLGFYNPASGQRLDLLDTAGNPSGNELTLGLIRIIPPPPPDQTCALIPATCR